MKSNAVDRVRAVMAKEWLELRRNRPALVGVLLMPAIMIVASTILLLQFRHVHPRDLRQLRIPVDVARQLRHPGEYLVVQFIRMFQSVFLLMPAVLPSAIAAYAIVGEKNNRSLEPLLATPLRTSEMLLGKMVAAAILGILPSWFSYGVFVSMLASFYSHYVVMQAAGPAALTMMFGAGPLLAVLSVSSALIVSSRVADPQSAQSLAAVIALPVMGLGVAQLAGAVQATFGVAAVIVSLLFLLDVGAFMLCVAVFERETILTRWK